jgi:hypothetical protein
MFPNPQDALPLPSRPNLEQYKKQAKDLVKACRSADSDAIRAWAETWVETLVKRSGLRLPPEDQPSELPVRIGRWVDEVEGFARKQLQSSRNAKCALTDAQFVLARSHGFLSWPKFAEHLNGLAAARSAVSRFEAAADAVVAGDVATLRRLLREDPELIRARSTREHRATLLHYVSANGVEGYRQKTPPNAVQVAELLLQAGAEVDAEADVYGGGATTIGLAATSVHPERAGVQIALLELLLQSGAAIEHPTAAGNRQGAVLGCLANGCGDAARFLAERGARLNLESAAGVGRLDVVESSFREDGRLKPTATKEQMQKGFLWACGYGRRPVVEFLLRKGVDPGTQGQDGQSGLHWAAIFGQLGIVKLLLEHGAPLEGKNVYGGTVLGQALWSAAHGGDPETYVAMIETLIAAGAKVPSRHPPVNQPVDELLQRHGSRADDELSWYGEKPRKRKGASR